MIRAVLITARQMQKGFQFFGSDPNRMALMALRWLEKNGEGNDVIEIYKEKLIQTVTIPPAEPRDTAPIAPAPPTGATNAV